MNYHKIETDNMDNGEGLRVVVWLSGCDHNCKKCFNPETHDPNSGKEFRSNQKNFIRHQLSKDYIDGVTFTGGDPFHSNNYKEVMEFCRIIKLFHPDKSIWVYTGYQIESFKCSELSYIDVLVDGKFIYKLEDRDLPWRGSTNQRIIDVKKSIKANRDDGKDYFYHVIDYELNRKD